MHRVFRAIGGHVFSAMARFAVLCSLVIVGPASAQAPGPAGSGMSHREVRGEVVRTLTALAPDDAALRLILAQKFGNGLKPSHVEASLTWLREIVLHPGLPELLAEVVGPHLREGMPVERIPSHLPDALSLAESRGLGRLSFQRQEAALKIGLDALRTARPEGCRRILLASLSDTEADKSDQLPLAGQTPEMIDEYLSLSQEAIRAEVAGFPAAFEPSTEQAELAKQAYLEQLNTVLDQHSIERLHAAFAQPEAVEASELCRLFLEALQITLRVQLPHRQWLIAYMLKSP